MDFEILYLINKLHSSLLDKIMVVITKLGDAGIIWIAIAVILLFIKKTRRCGILMLISLVSGLLLGNIVLKNLIQRPRPCWIDTSIPLLIPNLTDYSFPSGHTLASFEAAVMILLHNKKWGIPAIILASLIAFSRLYLFVHFPTDVLAGAVLGTLISLGVFVVHKKYKKEKINEKQ